MGKELWVSTTTGHRRKGTRFSSLRRLFDENVTVSSICESLQCVLSETEAVRARDILKSKEFDIAGVKNTEDETLLGYVQQQNLTSGLVKDHIIKFEAMELIAESTSLAEAISITGSQEYVFVLSGIDINSIITKADINKPPVRIYLFGMISLLEMHLNFWINHLLPNECWKENLNNQRLEGAIKQFELRSTKNEETSLLECLQFADKKTLLVGCDGFKNLFKFSNNSLKRLLERAETLRNELAHSQSSITPAGDWGDFVTLIVSIEHFLIESDQQVESMAIASSKSTGTSSDTSRSFVPV